MNIIFVSNKMAKPKTLSIWQVGLLLSMLMMLTASITATLILPHTSQQGERHGVKSLIPATLDHLNILGDRSQTHLNALALQLGQIQARVMRLDALSSRLAEMAGVKDKELESTELPGRGGPMVGEYNLSATELSDRINSLMHDLEVRSDRLNILEGMLLQQNLKKSTLPSGRPVDAAFNSSSFGYRVDPFTGQMAFHEGLDFMAEVGAPIYAAASGIVTQAELTPDYGNIVKIDHGNGLETRYAHASRLDVKVGDRVEKGQLIGAVGNTGRSTGAHLHFEVRLDGVALDPRKYLQNHAG
jgi:murein DD-endopeptidase MepM/ murein hydrolase activator NlpD